MTVCIAAACRDEDDQPAVVLCCDEQGTKSDWVSSENVKKIQWIGDRFAVMIAGDLGAAKELLAMLHKAFEGQRSKFVEAIESLQQIGKGEDPNDEDVRVTKILDQIRHVVRDTKVRVVDDYIWNRWGMGYKQFREESRVLPDLDYQDTLRHIENLDIGVSLIIVGLLQDDAMLIHVDQYTGKVSWLSNYVVIGSGALIAESLLAQYDYSEDVPIDKAVVLSYEAKVASERNPHVGNSTVMEALTRGGRKLVSTDVQMQLILHFSRREMPNIELHSDFLEDPEAKR